MDKEEREEKITELKGKIARLEYEKKKKKEHQHQIEHAAFTNILATIKPKSETEEWLIDRVKNWQETEASYVMPTDKVSLLSQVAYETCRPFTNNLGRLDYYLMLTTDRTGLKPAQLGTADKEQLETAFMGSVGHYYLQAMNSLWSYFDAGAYLYNKKFERLPNTHTSYSKLREWDPFSHQQPWVDRELLDLPLKATFPIKFENFFVSKSEIASIYVFQGDGSIESDFERSFRVNAYRNLVDETADDSSQTKLLAREKRKLVLVGWLAAKGYSTGDNVASHTKIEVWKELEKHCPELFSPKLTTDTIKKFAQGVCTFHKE